MTSVLAPTHKPTCQHIRLVSNSTCNQDAADIETDRNFVDKTLTAETGPIATSVIACPTPQLKPARHYAQTVDRGITEKVPPRVLRERIRYIALDMIDRFRYARTLDLAATCFAERPFPAAIAAAQRAMRGLKADGLVQEYVTDRHQHIYALTKAGADWLNIRAGGDAKASNRHASELTNPEHTLWSNFIQTCCEQRGLPALTEKQFLDGLPSNARSPGGGLLDVRTHTGVKKSLRPDVLAFDGRGAAWFEIDRSSRGAGRKQDLGLLFQSIGSGLNHKVDGIGDNVMFVSHAVICCLTPAIMRTAKRIFLESHPELKDPAAAMMDNMTINRSSRLVLETADAVVYEAWAMRRLPKPKNGWGVEPFIIGHATIQRLPTWLACYRTGGKVDGNDARGWFAENYLPYARSLRHQRAWTSPTTSLDRGTYNWTELGL